MAVPTLSEWLQTYNEHKTRQGRADATIQRYGELAQVWANIDPDGKGPLGNRPLNGITFDVLELCIPLLRRGYEHNSVRTAKGYLSSALQRAFLSRHVDRNECSLLDPIGYKQKRKLNLSSDGFAALCDAAADDATMIAALVLGRYGLRIAET